VSDLLDEQSAARYVGGNRPLSVRTLQRYRLTGEGPAYIKIGGGRRGTVRYRKEDLDLFLSARRRISTSTPAGGGAA
jgi:hypothetical protein